MGRRSPSPCRSRSPRRSRLRSRSSSPPPKRSRSRSRGDRRVRSRSHDRRRGRTRDRGSDRRGRSRSPPGRREPISLLVRNLSPETTQDELRHAFSRTSGDILDVYIPKEFNSNRPRGFAFIEFADARVGRDVKYEMDRSQLGGREIAVLFAKQHRKSPHEMRRILNVPSDDSPRRDGSPRRRSKSRSRSSFRKRRSSSPGEKRESTSPRGSPSRRASPSPKREMETPMFNAVADHCRSQLVKLRGLQNRTRTEEDEAIKKQIRGKKTLHLTRSRMFHDNACI
ncbi:hypothetical protein DD238_002346 [Peronospora effusa]|uniref:RRM domain-containing protein n=1 Tax=Peronospora effusa TaxID=542832 RepID=A0A3M6VKE5_9STRA|nr:hypothetical protein DD238_002346 [Peronospora effusa]